MSGNSDIKTWDMICPFSLSVPPNGMHTPEETVVCELRQPGPFLREACPLLTCFVFRSLMLGDKVGMKKQIKMSFLSYHVKSAYN